MKANRKIGHLFNRDQLKRGHCENNRDGF